MKTNQTLADKIIGYAFWPVAQNWYGQDLARYFWVESRICMCELMCSSLWQIMNVMCTRTHVCTKHLVYIFSVFIGVHCPLNADLRWTFLGDGPFCKFLN